jgi:hypothetical protein
VILALVWVWALWGDTRSAGRLEFQPKFNQMRLFSTEPAPIWL